MGAEGIMAKLLYYLTPGCNPYENLAAEEALMSLTAPDTIIMYLWQNDKTVVIGRNQCAYRECNINILNSDGGHLARRLSGGGAVYHDLGNLNFTFLAKPQSYDVKKQLTVICEAVKSFGITSEISGRNDLIIKNDDGEFKFSGNAFYESSSVCFHHGTIMISCNVDNMSRYLNVSASKLKSHGVNSVKARVTNLNIFNDKVTPSSMISALKDAFEKVYGSRPEAMILSENQKALFGSLTEKFASPEWIYGHEPKFTDELCLRSPTGHFQIDLTVIKGKISSCDVYTDDLDVTAAQKIESALTGLPYLPEELEKVFAEYGIERN